MDALRAAGNEAVKKGDFSAAVEHYKRSLAQVPAGKDEEAAPIQSNLSFALLKLKQFEEALAAADDCVATKPSWQKGFFRRGEALFALRRYDEAEAAYAKALELAPDDATLKRRLALTREALQGFFFRQLSPGRHFAVGKGSTMIQAQINGYAVQMQNFVYLVGDARTREVLLVDPAWDVESILEFAEGELVKVVGVAATHYHFDHVGGTPPAPFDSLGIKIPGVKEVAAKTKTKVYINKHDAEMVKSKTALPASSVVELQHGSEVEVGAVRLVFLHTPGHSAGSQCIHIPNVPGSTDKIVLTGDTLFLGSCGRLDMPDSDLRAMYHSLQSTLGALPDATRVYPGHNYGGAFTSIGAEKRSGMLAKMSEEKWFSLHHRM